MKKKIIAKPIGYAVVNGMRFELLHYPPDFSVWKIVIGKDTFGAQFDGRELIGEMFKFSKMSPQQRDKLPTAE